MNVLWLKTILLVIISLQKTFPWFRLFPATFIPSTIQLRQRKLPTNTCLLYA
ncbi:hypothetical protein Golax_002840, partial [Gossypium laxum]|nr:hypothetical protein [Gossypium laxum]